MTAITTKQCLTLISQLRNEGLEISSICSRLKEQNIPSDIAEQAVLEWKKIYYSKKRNQGFLYVGIGTSVMVVSFLLSVILFYSDKSIDWALYGLTFLGLSLTFKGMVDILGW
jgi:hypothetical protein